jgi:hypothetical protein
MRKYKVGDHLWVKLSGGRIVEAVVKAITESTDGVRLQVSFGNETALLFICGKSSKPTRGYRYTEAPIDEVQNLA